MDEGLGSSISPTVSSMDMTSVVWELYNAGISVLLILAIITGNTITLVAMAKNKPLRRKENILIGSLSAADLLVGLVSLLSFAVKALGLVAPGWNFDDILTVVVIQVSMLHMVFIGINRFIAVVLPLRYGRLVTKRTVVIMAVLVWVIPVVLIVPLYLYALTRDPLSNGLLYIEWVNSFNYITSFVFLTMSLIVLYGKIVLETRAQANRVQVLRQQPVQKQGDAGGVRRPQNNNQGPADRSKKSTRLVLVILFIAMILNTPFFIFTILLVAGYPQNLAMGVLVYISLQCYLANSAINIVIYAVFTSDFRKAYKNLLCCLCQKADVTVQFPQEGSTINDNA